MPMNSADYAKEFVKGQRPPRNNVFRAQTLSASLALEIYLMTYERNFATPWLCVRSDLKSKIPIVHASPYLATGSIISAI